MSHVRDDRVRPRDRGRPSWSAIALVPALAFAIVIGTACAIGRDKVASPVNGEPILQSDVRVGPTGDEKRATTLRADPQDSPSPVSAAEAARARGGSPRGHEGHGTPKDSTSPIIETPQAGPHEHEPREPSAIVYTCPMHPSVEAGAPGQCPICGMDLVEKKKEGSE